MPKVEVLVSILVMSKFMYDSYQNVKVCIMLYSVSFGAAR